MYIWGQQYGWENKGIPFPQLVTGLPEIKEISGLYALDVDGKVWMLNGIEPPTPIDGLSNVVSISDTVNDILAAVTLKGQLWLWAPEVAEYREETLVQVKHASQVKAVYGDVYDIYWIDQDHKVWRAGIEWDAKLHEPTAVALPEGKKAMRVETTYEDDYLVTTDGNIVPIQQERQPEYEVPEQTVQIAGTYGMRFYLKSDGTVGGEANSYVL